MIVAESSSGPDSFVERLDGASQIAERRPRAIQCTKPAAKSARVGHAMRIFHRWSGRLPATAFDKVAPQRRTARDQAVVGIGKRERRQEGHGLTAGTADAASNLNPVMVFVMSLFAATTMTNDRISRANRAPANNPFRASLRPISF